MSKTDATDTPSTQPASADTATVQLERPIRRGDATVTSVVLRKPRTGELRGLSLTDVLTTSVDAHIKLIPRISTPTLIAAELEAMDPADFAALAGEVVAFLLPRDVRASLPA